jgi:8-oxo-dGTP pyrophosphatase MutT (NUDIX family)
MVQRKDSLSYVEFMRGKYDLENKTYIMKLLSNMTEQERIKVKTSDFDTLWKEMWCKGEDNGKNFNREYVEAAEKFMRLKRGYYIKSDDQITFVNIEHFVNETVAEHDDTEWGFPKGRRNVNENDINCALREFKEETGFNPKCLQLSSDTKPLGEVFSGTNKKRYKHVYYIAQFSNEDTDFYEFQPSCREIKDVKWFTYDEAQSNIRDINVERKELLKRLNHIITKSL